MKILVLNCGSSSIKFQLFNIIKKVSLSQGIIEKIGTYKAILRYKNKNKKEVREIQEVLNHEQAINLVFNTLLHPQYGIIKDKSEISGIGHRVVHGGERFSGSSLISEEVISVIKENFEFAPLHNPHNLKGVEICNKILPDIPQVAVFDTAFHHKMPNYAYIYGVPYELYLKLGIRRYGFHGTSHQWVAQKTAEYLNKPIEKCKIITCHLGNGASIAAIKGGNSIDTSMGFTPLEGLLMGTRCGDLDPALILYIMEKEKLSLQEINDLLNKYSGLKGVCQTTGDMREIEEEALKGSSRHKLALDIFCYRIKKYIGAYIAVTGGIDAIAFTGGIGENSRLVRQKALENLEFLGIKINKEANLKNSTLIGLGKVKIFVIPTNEEFVIAEETKRIIEKLKIKEKISILSKEEKAELILLWAKYPKASALELAKIISQNLKKEFTEFTIKKELEVLGLGIRIKCEIIH